MVGEIVGTVEALWRYPVRSVLGEALEAATLGENGVIGDRSYSVVDNDKFAMVSAAISAKEWSALVGVRAEFVEEPTPDAPPPPVRLLFPDGTELVSDNPALTEQLTALTGRTVSLWSGQASGAAKSDEADPRADGKASPAAPYELTPIHLLTTATVRAANSVYPEGVFNPIRFRPNIVLDTPDATGFAENEWLGKTLAIGEDVRLKLDDHCVRCVMTTLGHGDLEEDRNILKTVYKENNRNFGIYASVATLGQVRAGDTAVLLDG
jgi:uncharacterized protein YcbX